MTQFTVPALLLRRAFETAMAFAHRDEEDGPHPALSTVRIDPLPEAVRISATDRYVASIETLKAEGEPFAVIVPLRVAERVVSLIPLPSDEPYAQPEYRMVTFVREKDGGPVTVRAVGETTATITFTPETWELQGLGKIFTDAEAAGATEVAFGLHVDPDRMAEVMAAIQGREDRTPVRFVSAAPDKPLVLAQGTDFKVMLMPVRVHRPRPAKQEVEAVA